MNKNTNFKNISFSNFEYISIFVIIFFCGFISNIPKNILETCSNASLLGVVILSVIAFVIFYFLNKVVFKEEFDFYGIIKNTYPRPIVKLLGILLYIFCMIFIYIIISNITFNLRATTYSLSSVFDIAIYFVIALLLTVRQGFNSIFRISGYIIIPLISFTTILFILSLAFTDINNMLPILGNGVESLFITNLPSIAIFSPLFFTLLFGFSKKNKDSSLKEIESTEVSNLSNNNIENLDTTTDKKNFKEKKASTSNFIKVFMYSAVPLAMMIFMFIGAMPTELLSDRYALLFDISRLVSFSTTSIKFSPVIIFTYSFIIYIATSFILLIGCNSLERLNVVKDYSNIIITSVVIMGISFMLPSSLMHLNILQNAFNIVSIFACIIFPIFTVILYIIKKKFKTSRIISRNLGR